MNTAGTEFRVVGAVLLKPAMFEECGLAPSDFQTHMLRDVWETIGAMLGRGEKVDPVTVSEYGHSLADLGEIANTSGYAPGNAPQYAGMMKRESSRRYGQAVLRDSLERLNDPASDVAATFADTQMSLEQLATGTPLLTAAEAVRGVAEYRAESNALRAAYGIAGIPTGHQPLRQTITGWRPRSFYVLAARPGGGKSSAAFWSALTAAELGIAVGYITLEMTADEVMARAICARLGVDSVEFTSGLYRVTAADKQVIAALAKLPILIDEESTRMSRILSRMAEMKRKGCDVIFLDHFGLCEADGSQQSDNRVLELGSISRDLRLAAKRLNVAIVGLYQLNRAVEHERRPPGLHDLRGSGMIEENCTHAIFLNDTTTIPEHGAPPAIRTIQWVIAKNRHGPRGVAPTDSAWDPRVQTWA